MAKSICFLTKFSLILFGIIAATTACAANKDALLSSLPATTPATTIDASILPLPINYERISTLLFPETATWASVNKMPIYV